MGLVCELRSAGGLPHHEVGGKAAQLAALMAAGERVPAGFVVGAQAFEQALAAGGIGGELEGLLSAVDPGDLEGLHAAAARARALLGTLSLPAGLEDQVGAALDRLGLGVASSVAVRSSASAEDLPRASFAGQYDSLLGLQGRQAVLDGVRQVWASRFGPRAWSYLARQGLSPMAVRMAVLVQRMIPATVAGVMFTLDPSNGDRSKVVIEAGWGLGRGVVEGAITPDRVVVDKVLLEIEEHSCGTKPVEWILDRRSGRVRQASVGEERSGARCLASDEVLALARRAKALEARLGAPQDIEWAIDREDPGPQGPWILQARPETVWSGRTAPRLSGSLGVSWGRSISEALGGRRGGDD